MLDLILAAAVIPGTTATKLAPLKQPHDIAQIAQQPSSSQDPATTINDQQNKAAAKRHSYPYASIQAGVAIPDALNGKVTTGFEDFFTTRNSLDLNTGFGGELAIGYKFPAVRTDLSVGYMSLASRTQTLTLTSNVNDFSASASIPGKGNVNLLTVMANVYYDIPIYTSNGRSVKLALEPVTATPDQDYSTAIETWDPAANNNAGAWKTYKPGSHIAIPDQNRDNGQNRNNSERNNKPDNLLVRVALRQGGSTQPNATFRLIVSNRDDQASYAVATLRGDGTGTLYATRPGQAASDAGVSPATNQQPDSPLVIAADGRTTTDPALTARSQGDRRSIRLNNISVNPRSAYAVFSVQADPVLSPWSPYIGAGIGYGNLNTPGCAYLDCKTFTGGSAGNFAYQAKAGLSYRATSSGSLFLEGAYVGMSGPKIENVNYDAFGAWRVNLGWRQRL